MRQPTLGQVVRRRCRVLVHASVISRDCSNAKAGILRRRRWTCECRCHSRTSRSCCQPCRGFQTPRPRASRRSAGLSQGGVTQFRRILRETTGDAANLDFPADWHPPYKTGTKVTEFQTGVEEQFVRLHVGGNQNRKWVMKADAVRGLTPQQLHAKYQLPAQPTHISPVTLPPGTRVRYGIVNPGFNLAPPSTGLARQYEVLDNILDGWFGEMTSL